MKKRTLALLMIFTMMGTVFAGCGKKDAEETAGKEDTNDLLAVAYVEPETTDINIMGEYVGTLEYNDQIAVYPMLSGAITNTYFEEGDYVEEGELMFTLDDEAYQLQLQNATKTYQSAENGLEQQLGALEMQRNSALNNLDTAKEGIVQIQDTYDYYSEQMNDIDTTKDDLHEDRVDMKQDLIDLRNDRDDAEDDLKDAQKAAKKAATEYYTAMGLMEQQTANGGSIAGEPLVTKTELSMLQGTMEATASAAAGLAQQIAAYNSAEAQLEAAIKQYDSSMDQLDSSKEGLQFQQDNLEYSMQQAKRGEILAQNNLDYFDNYTAPMTKEAAEISLSQARIGISSAELQLSYTQVKAPVSGNVVMKNNEVNDLAQAGYPVYVIIPENTKYASFNVPESVWRELKIGDKAIVERNGVEYNATISEIPTSVNQQTGMFTVKVAISGDTDDLTTGTSVVVKTVIKSLNGALTIPIDCVYYEGGNSYTYTVSDDGIVSKVYIQTGMYDDMNMEITDGITPDMNIITTWSSDLHDGLKVRINNDTTEE